MVNFPMAESSEAPRSVLWLNQLDPAHPWAGGAERHIAEVGRRLTARGSQVTLVSERFQDLPPVDQLDGGLRVVRPVRRGLLHAWVLANARRLVERYAVDVVVGDLSKVVPWGRSSFGGRPLVTVVRHFSARQLFREAPFPAGPILWAVERFSPVLLQSSPLLTESSETAGILRRLGARPGTVRRIPPGVDTGRFRPDPSQRAPHPLVAYIGRLKRYKRIDLAIRAFASVRRTNPRAEFLIAGVGSEQGHLEEQVRALGLHDAVRFLGGLPVEEIVRLYQRAWVHVQPSSAEGWGLTALESMACGTPVVAFQGGSLAETVGPVCADLLAEPNSATSLAQALSRGLERTASGGPSAASNLVQYASRFTWEATADQYASVLGALASGREIAEPFGERFPRPAHSPGGSAARGAQVNAAE